MLKSEIVFFALYFVKYVSDHMRSVFHVTASSFYGDLFLSKRAKLDFSSV